MPISLPQKVGAFHYSTKRNQSAEEMASSFGSDIIIIIVVIITINVPAEASNQYKVGDAEGWLLPNEKNTELYKIWASKITFHVGDSIVFEYKNDSVVKVDKRGYYHCNETTQGSMFRDGNTVFPLDKPGLYYFVSGDFDHCRKGQRLMIEVKGQQLPPSMAGPSPSPLPSAAVSWIIPPFRTLVALEAFMIMACCPLYGPWLAA